MLSFLAVLLLSPSTSWAQESYQHGLGLRLGSSYGISYKTFLKNNLAFEGILSSRYYGYRGNPGNGWGNNNYRHRYYRSGGTITGLLEYHIPIEKVPELSFFVGGGLHLAFWQGDDDDPFYDDEDRSYAIFGLDAIFGVEYVFKDLPLALAFDIKPSFHFTPYDNFWPDEVAISVRFLLDRI